MGRDESGMSKVFDLPHARVTLTAIGPGIEIEVWPKAGQSAYAVVDPVVAIAIAQSLVELSATQLASTGSDEPEPEPAGPDEADANEHEAPGNVVDLASRRRPGR